MVRVCRPGDTSDVQAQISTITAENADNNARVEAQRKRIADLETRVREMATAKQQKLAADEVCGVHCVLLCVGLCLRVLCVAVCLCRGLHICLWMWVCSAYMWCLRVCGMPCFSLLGALGATVSHSGAAAIRFSACVHTQWVTGVLFD